MALHAIRRLVPSEKVVVSDMAAVGTGRGVVCACVIAVPRAVVAMTGATLRWSKVAILMGINNGAAVAIEAIVFLPPSVRFRDVFG